MAVQIKAADSRLSSIGEKAEPAAGRDLRIPAGLSALWAQVGLARKGCSVEDQDVARS